MNRKIHITALAIALVMLLTSCIEDKPTSSEAPTTTTTTTTVCDTGVTDETSTSETSTDTPLLASAYKGEPYIVVNNNEPYFTAEEITTTSFESYSELDDLGRCGVAFACIGKDLMPTEERGAIGNVKPSGWHTSNYNAYPGLVDGNYLYNRCHLIAFMLAGENANNKNLITGTRYLNIEGMLPWEDTAHDYLIANPTNHIMYRVTPIFTGNNLVAEGVLMEAYSVEDDGALKFCIFAYNVQPHIVIDYATGDNHIEDGYTGATSSETTETTKEWEDNPEYYTYVLNENSKKIHLPTCDAVQVMDENNKTYTNRSYDELIAEGYTPCGICHPH